MQRAGWSTTGDNNMTTRVALPRRPRSKREAENRELCGPARQKYFHLSDGEDKGTSAHESGHMHLKLHITRGSVPFMFHGLMLQSFSTLELGISTN